MNAKPEKEDRRERQLDSIIGPLFRRILPPRKKNPDGTIEVMEKDIFTTDEVLKIYDSLVQIDGMEFTWPKELALAFQHFLEEVLGEVLRNDMEHAQKPRTRFSYDTFDLPQPIFHLHSVSGEESTASFAPFLPLSAIEASRTRVVYSNLVRHALPTNFLLHREGLETLVTSAESNPPEKDQTLQALTNISDLVRTASRTQWAIHDRTNTGNPSTVLSIPRGPYVRFSEQGTTTKIITGPKAREAWQKIQADHADAQQNRRGRRHLLDLLQDYRKRVSKS
ncbi:MAG: hypothetical protein UW70_C0010G0013 [Candidatus Peregrinibacteria bacterium GW2011_GWA2_44_7]|nr:MAG: hypothetical protein UW70_C0010G0013 [Candidatus Peregrinibacteria bacterium GW2011_GWA2_44_7]